MSQFNSRNPVPATLCSSALAFVLAVGLVGSQVQSVSAAPCVLPDNGGGTIFLPPAGCGYVSPTDFHEMQNGLPPGSTIVIGAEHIPVLCREQGGNCPPPALCPDGPCELPGGTLGGFIEKFPSELRLTLNGTGALSGVIVNEQINMLGVKCETHSGPRTPGAPVQSFPADMRRISGQGSSQNFAILKITAGTDFGLPSPGHTTLTHLGGGNWNVDSFFDVTYTIDFVGQNALNGMSGSTTGTIRMQVGVPLTSSADIPLVDMGARLLEARPNPFSDATTIGFELQNAGPVDLRIYDASGRIIRQIMSNTLEAGTHEASWNGYDDKGKLVAAGTYFTELRFNGRVVDRKKATLMQ